jgi:hypothetical protein
MRMLDDVYGDDQDCFPLEQDARKRMSRLEWADEIPVGEEEYWYLVPDEDEDVWYVSADKQALPFAPRR